MTSVPVTIRRERADHPQVVALLQALDHYLAALYEPEANHIMSVADLLAPDVRFVAAWAGDRIVGTGAVRLRAAGHDDDDAPYGEVKRMYVDPSVRGQRIGERLLRTLEHTLRDEGMGLARLETGRDQHAAVRLYERCGFVQRGAFGGYPDNGLSLFMEKRLPAGELRQERAA